MHIKRDRRHAPLVNQRLFNPPCLTVRSQVREEAGEREALARRTPLSLKANSTLAPTPAPTISLSSQKQRNLAPTLAHAQTLHYTSD